MISSDLKRTDLALTLIGGAMIIGISFLSGVNHLFALGFLILPLVILALFFPFPLFLMFVASFPFNVIAVSQDVGLSIPRAIGFILLLSWALYIFRYQRADVLKLDRVSLNFLLFIAWGLVSIIWSVDPLRSAMVGFTLLQLLAFYFISMSLIDHTKKLKLIAYAILASSTYVAISSIIMSVNQLRAVGVKGSDENEFAALMIFPIYLSLNFALLNKKIWAKVLFGAMIIILLLGAASTVSRGFLVAIIISFIYRIFLDSNKRRAMAAILLLLGLTGPYLFVRYAKRAASEKPLYVKEIPSGRQAIWIVGVEMIKEHPFFGIGMGSFPTGYDEEYQESRSKTGYAGYGRVGHNDFITILVEYGAVGLIIWLGLLTYILKESRRLNFYFMKTGDEYLYAVANAVACSLLALLLCQAFLGLYLTKFFWLPIGFIAILKTIAAKHYGHTDDSLI